MSSQGQQQTVAYAPCPPDFKSHTIIISIATGDPNEPTLAGVKGDFPLVLDELTAHTNGSFQVMTDFQLPQSIQNAQMLLPSARSVCQGSRDQGR
ncbi:hypothetical protein M407DRAFT_26340 [Tulasnella calospora MUT 4182]|uniref:Uncharacterized protein n=1 Tax=Tulasnella calospora MUT 4182 TaxID=1051891 RepID=A0A0C3KRZ6_9AGAM|nr:hypothetical protein M407DRAFT_26340 [Tulasnella calospora MUT 4182]